MRNAQLGQQAAINALQLRPALNTIEDYYWKVFGDLTTERPPAMAGVARIPFFKIVAYASFMRSTDLERCELLRVMQNLDIHYIDKVNKKLESKTK